VSELDVVRSVEIRAAPERVFELLTDPDELVRWWPDVVDLEPQTRGEVRLSFSGSRRTVTGRVTRFEPPRAFGFTWSWEDRPDEVLQVDFTVREVGDGRCEVRVVHSGWKAFTEARRRHDLGWAHFLGCLRDLAEARPFDKTFRPS
jgi:uncharacterized protein YndB with AHSA1/START domain